MKALILQSSVNLGKSRLPSDSTHSPVQIRQKPKFLNIDIPAAFMIEHQVQKWQILDSTLVLDNPWCRVKQDRVLLPNGTIIEDYFVNLRSEIVLVFPLTVNQDVIFVRQYRHGVEEILLELPAGSFEPQTETSIAAAQRELREETGYVASELIPLAQIYDNPVKDKTRLHLFLAPNVEPTGQQEWDITEAIEVVLIPLLEVKTKILTGEIQVAGSIAALFLGLEKLAQPPFNKLL
jgi:8-oxo-dGTP pyrophosphatase MutT (NUDIX family)